MIDEEYLQGSSDIIAKLRQISALDSFDDESLQELLPLSQAKDYKPGEMVFEEGSHDNRIYYLISGKIKIEKQGKRLVVLQRTGDVFGEMGAIDDSVRSASAVAITDAVCIAVDLSKINRIALEDKFVFRHLIYKSFAEILANRLRSTSEELVRAKDEIERLNIAKRLGQALEELGRSKEQIDQLSGEVAKLKKIIALDK